jgi:ATP-dependent DNA ligase
MVLASCRVKDAILDGEIVCLDAGGHSMFKELLYPHPGARPHSVSKKYQHSTPIPTNKEKPLMNA